MVRNFSVLEALISPKKGCLKCAFVGKEFSFKMLVLANSILDFNSSAVATLTGITILGALAFPLGILPVVKTINLGKLNLG
jgi:hypothetical protein